MAGYLYWDQENSTYAVAPPAASSNADATTTSTTTTATGKSIAATTITQANVQPQPPPPPSFDQRGGGGAMAAVIGTAEKDSSLSGGGSGKKNHDKVKVAKKIVKDMEKWAKQLNQKKDMNQMQAPAPQIEEPPPSQMAPLKPLARSGGYADVGFSILENKDRITAATSSLDSPLAAAKPPPPQQQQMTKIVSAYGSDSDTETNDAAASMAMSENDYVDFEKLTCLLCKRAFQSLDILNKHLKMSNLHKENLLKWRGGGGGVGGGTSGGADGGSVTTAEMDAANLAYRDRAKERRLKYGESDPPPVNKSRERFEKEMQKQKVAMQAQTSSKLASVPIGENNVGNRLLQKMGWTEGQGLGRKNQGRTNIIEVLNAFRNVY